MGTDNFGAEDIMLIRWKERKSNSGVYQAPVRDKDKIQDQITMKNL